jgi:anti-anti-sigma factor
VESSSGPIADLWVVGDTATDGVLALTVTGELTVTTADTACTQLTAFLGRSSAPEATVDLSGLTFCDLTGLRVLLQAAARGAAAGRPVRVVAASAEVQWLMTLTEAAPSLGYRPAAEPPPPGAGSA